MTRILIKTLLVIAIAAIGTFLRTILVEGVGLGQVGKWLIWIFTFVLIAYVINYKPDNIKTKETIQESKPNG